MLIQANNFYHQDTDYRGEEVVANDPLNSRSVTPKEFDPDDIVDAAMQVFWQRGYSATSIQDLVKGTELGRSSIYNAFGSKHELMSTRFADIRS
ncbi:hypothetical protein ABID47_001505 [Paenibacillus favisporus]|uniref:HTH tetR-type domain-containing protein n=1 Tax=Paenibacillus favisporus TaxID=221028 RepID=A0ABV2EZL0_9BACL